MPKASSHTLDNSMPQLHRPELLDKRLDHVQTAVHINIFFNGFTTYHGERLSYVITHSFLFLFFFLNTERLIGSQAPPESLFFSGVFPLSLFRLVRTWEASHSIGSEAHCTFNVYRMYITGIDTLDLSSILWRLSDSLNSHLRCLFLIPNPMDRSASVPFSTKPLLGSRIPLFVDRHGGVG